MRANGHKDVPATFAVTEPAFRREAMRIRISWSANGRWSFGRDPREEWQK